MDMQVVVRAIDHLTAPFQTMTGAVGGFADKTRTLEERLQGAQTAGFAMSAAGGAITGTFLAAAKSASDFGSELWDMHTRTGASVESLSAMKYAAEQTGTSLSGVQNGLKLVAKNAYESMRTGTGPAADAFKRIGVNVTDSSGKLKSSEALFTEVGTALRGVNNDAERTALAMAIFGRSGQQLLPMFLDTKGGIKDLMAEAKSLGLVMSTESAQAADDFGDSLDRLKAQSKMTFVGLGIAAMPTLQRLGDFFSGAMQKMQSFRSEHPLLASAAVTTAGGLGVLLSTLGPLLIVLPSLVNGWNMLSTAMTWNNIQARTAGVSQFFAASAAKVASVWANVSSASWWKLNLSLMWTKAQAAWAGAGLIAASAQAKIAGAWAAVSAGGWTGLTAAIWGGVTAAWAFITSPLGLTLIAAAGAMLLLVRAVRMGAEAWKAWHEAKEGKKRTERQEAASKAEGLVTPAAVAKDMGLEKKWERGTMSAEENARFQAELQRRMKAAGEARRKAGTAGGMKTDWAGDMGTAAQADSPDALQADMQKIKAEAAAMQANMGAAPTMPATPETKAGGAAAGGPAAVYKFDETSMGLLRSIADTTKEILGKMGGGGVSTPSTATVATDAAPAMIPAAKSAGPAVAYQKRTDAQGKVNWDKITLPAAQPALRSANAGAGGGGINLTVNANIDARGATDPAAVRQAGQQGATQVGQETLRMFRRNMGRMGLAPQGVG